MMISLYAFYPETRTLVLRTPEFDVDSFPTLGKEIVAQLGCRILEQQQDSDMHLWLLDFKGTHLMLKSEGYSQSCWLEALSKEDEEVLMFLANWLK
ncbi:DUF3630 family protein [Thaumasiovibrio subtropicus]|uniref:DUF3630 family protein n=1 Tax=Thaumasiovibrio subtropicus TaxID=1891207 RepID=UPI000B3522A5|nr:DUF3630 family protein [Thaumasiovibrio subtropicus]